MTSAAESRVAYRLFRTRGGNILLSLFIFCVLVGGLEIGTRVALFFLYDTPATGHIAKLSYEPYLVWVKEKKQTDFNAILTEGFPNKGDSYRILLLGGSTAEQIPSEMVEEAFQPYISKKVEVVNMAQAGYIAKQALLTLVLYGIRVDPDMVISLDGGNDVSTFAKKMPVGINYNTTYVKRAVERPLLNALFSILNQSKFVLVMIKLKERAVESHASERQEDFDLWVNDYLATMETMAALSATKKARFITVLQPYLFLRNNITEREKKLLPSKQYRRAFFKKAWVQIKDQLSQHQLPPNATFVSGIEAFDNTNRECFKDWVHLTHEGNRELACYLAEKIFEGAET